MPALWLSNVFHDRPSVEQIVRAYAYLCFAVGQGTNRNQLPGKKRQAKNNRPYETTKRTRNENHAEEKPPEADDVRTVMSRRVSSFR